MWWDVADYVWWDVADYVSILKSNSATTNEAAPYSRLGIDASFQSITRNMHAKDYKGFWAKLYQEQIMGHPCLD